MENSFSSSMTKLARLFNSFLRRFRNFILWVNPFFLELSYFIFISVAGHAALKFSKPKTDTFSPKDLDIFFSSVSAATVSSMSVVEMEVLSNIQLIFLTILMLAGGEVFTSMLGLQLMKYKCTKLEKRENPIDPLSRDSDFSNPKNLLGQIELQIVSHDPHELQLDQKKSHSELKSSQDPDLLRSSIELLAYLVLLYLIAVHVAGASLISIYTLVVPNAREVLKKKGLSLMTFAAFTTASTFSNCGFVPTNENMMVFKNNSGLLLILIPLVLLGNTLYPACLGFMIWLLEKFTKRAEFSYMLKNSRAMRYTHLFSGLYAKFLTITALGFILVQFIAFCSLEWHSEATAGLSTYRKLVGSLFQVLNSRHSGESVFDLSMLSPAILVLFVIMMYLPPYTFFLPKDAERISIDEETSKGQRKNIFDYLLFSQLTYVGIFIILICITEREKMKEDPLNFNIFNIVFEVISAYGNVGFSIGYSCERQIKPSDHCKDYLYGFAGRWSNKGKFIPHYCNVFWKA